jgi:hypothetical protein
VKANITLPDNERNRRTMRNTVTSLSPMRLASKLCTIGAGIILALGIASIVVFYVLNNDNNNGPNSGPGIGVILFVALIIAILIFFFSLILFALGALLSYLSAPNITPEESVTHPKIKDVSEEGDAQLEITPIPKMR